MRLFSRFHVVCTAAACIILYSAWFLTSRNLGNIVPLASEKFQTIRSFDRRLVVFGDSWSDNETREAQGVVWTDWLCSMISCHQENLAQTANGVFRGRHLGSVVDNRELDLLGRLSQTRLADFKAQLRQWLDAESRLLEKLSPDQIRSRWERTIFVVSFGVWDLLSLVTKDYETAIGSVDRRIQTLMGQLDQLLEHGSSTELKVLLTQPVDVTFLPGFTSTGTEYKDIVKTRGHWNTQLRESVSNWNRGTIYLFDTNAFLLDRIRDWQLWAAGIETAEGLEQNRDPGWENVGEACVESESGFQVMMSKDEHKKPCAHPEKYLFWYESSPIDRHVMSLSLISAQERGTFGSIDPPAHGDRDLSSDRWVLGQFLVRDKAPQPTGVCSLDIVPMNAKTVAMSQRRYPRTPPLPSNAHCAIPDAAGEEETERFQLLEMGQ